MADRRDTADDETSHIAYIICVSNFDSFSHYLRNALFIYSIRSTRNYQDWTATGDRPKDNRLCNLRNRTSYCRRGFFGCPRRCGHLNDRTIHAKGYQRILHFFGTATKRVSHMFREVDGKSIAALYRK
jgi:hypothetical protein